MSAVGTINDVSMFQATLDEALGAAYETPQKIHFAGRTTGKILEHMRA